MTIRVWALAAAMCTLVLSPAVAEDLSGTYRVKGLDAAGRQSYKGEVAVKKVGETYRVAWVMEDHRAVGTGMVKDKTFAITFVTSDTGTAGLALFELGEEGELNGRFTILGASQVGQEVWTPLTH